MDLIIPVHDGDDSQSEQRHEEKLKKIDMLNESRATYKDKYLIEHKKFRDIYKSEKDAMTNAEKKCYEHDKQVFFKIYKHFLH